AIDVVSEDGSIVRAASASEQGVEMGGESVAAGVIRSRRPLLVPEVAQAPPDLLEAFMGSRILSYVGVPLVARSRMVGCLSLAQVCAGVRRYGPDELPLAQDLGQRVALALDRSRLFEAQRHIAMPLQAILLRLNEAVMDERPSSRFLTIAFGQLRWRASGLRLTVACGGHPPPLLLRAAGGVERAARPGTLIGFLPSPELPEKVNELKVGD